MGHQELGARIRESRELRMLTQVELGRRSHLSVSYVTKVERGERMPSPAAQAAIARALGMDVARLHNQPYSEEEDTGYHAAIPELRRALLCHRYPQELDVPARPFAALHADVRRACQLRLDGDYSRLSAMLPALLDELVVTVHSCEADHQQEAFRTLAHGYRCANSVAHKQGYLDLSALAVDRLVWAAGQSQDPLMVATAALPLAGAMLRDGAVRAGVAVLRQAELDLLMLSPTGEDRESHLAVHGAILLKRAMLMARLGDTNGAYTLLDHAEELADQLGRDVTCYESPFGPTNAKIHTTAAAIEVDDCEGAVRYGTDLQLPAGLPGERGSHHYIDLAHAQVAIGQREEAFTSLMTARRISPQHTRNHPRTRHTAAVLARLDRHRSETVSGFARWAGALS